MACDSPASLSDVYSALRSSDIKPIEFNCTVLGRELLDIRQPISLRKGD
jgi:hypothetical protein